MSFIDIQATLLVWLTSRTSLVAQMVKNLPAMQKTQFDFWVRKMPLEEGMSTHSIILA